MKAPRVLMVSAVLVILAGVTIAVFGVQTLYFCKGPATDLSRIGLSITEPFECRTGTNTPETDPAAEDTYPATADRRLFQRALVLFMAVIAASVMAAVAWRFRADERRAAITPTPSQN